MKGKHLLSRPVAVNQLTDDDLYQDADDSWQQKAQRLQARRWRKLRHQTA